MANSIFSTTTLVIGAGAHKPYGFPTAADLRKQILGLYSEEVFRSFEGSPRRRKLSEKHSIIEDRIELCAFMDRLGIIRGTVEGASVERAVTDAQALLNEFLVEFAQSQRYSVDAFLARFAKSESRSRMHQKMEVGKLVIAYLLRRAEVAASVGFSELDWIQFVLNKHLDTKTEVDRFFKEPPKIFTFNYDNFFERSLYLFLIHAHGMSENESRRLVESLPIVHAYGDLGNGFDDCDFKQPSHYLKASSRLRVIGEERASQQMDNVTTQFREAILNSASLYFLGFGFDPQNCEMLFKHCDKEEFRQVKVHTTNYGVTDYEMRMVSKRVPFSFSWEKGADVDCLALISEKKPIFEPPVRRAVGITRVNRHRGSDSWMS